MSIEIKVVPFEGEKLLAEVGEPEIRRSLSCWSGTDKMYPDAKKMLSLATHRSQTVGFQYFLYYKGTCILYAVFVIPGYRRQGIATRLLMEAIECSRSLGYESFAVPFKGEPTEGRLGLRRVCERYASDHPELTFQITGCH